MRRIHSRTLASFLFLSSIGLASSLWLASDAEAHLGLIEPESRYGTSVLKDGPCGMTGGTRSTNVVTLAPGASLTIRWDEYVNHPGHYRIAFDDDGDDDFQAPPCLSSCDSTSMVIGVAPDDYTDPTVLADGIPDMGGGEYSFTVTLPDVECDNCTLQVIQVMTDKPPYTTPGNDLYFQCIDLVLTSGGAPDGGTVVLDGGGGGGTDGGGGGGTDGGGGGGTDGGGGGGGTDDGGCGCAAAGHGPALPPLAALGAALALGLLVRRRR
jgi:MYXO-CTERM domain-containing protein